MIKYLILKCPAIHTQLQPKTQITGMWPVGAKVIQAKMGDSLMYSPYIVQYNSQQQLPGFVPSRIVLFTNFTIVSHLQVCQKNLVK